MPYTASLSLGVSNLNVVDLRKMRSGSCEAARAGDRDARAARRMAVRNVAMVSLLPVVSINERWGSFVFPPMTRRPFRAARRFLEERDAALSRQAVEQIGVFARLCFQAAGETALKRIGARGVEQNRVGERGRQQRRLVRIELSCALAEIALGRGFDTVDPVAPFGDVEINLKRARLRPGLAHDERHSDLDTFADGGAARPQEPVPRGLHGDGRGASGRPVFASAAQNLAERAPVDAIIVAEALELRGDHRGEGNRRDGLQRRVNALVALTLDRARKHERRDRPDECIKTNQDNEEREKRQSRPDDAKRQTTKRGSPPRHAEALAQVAPSSK